MTPSEEGICGSVLPLVTAVGPSPCQPHLWWMLSSLVMQCGALLQSREHLVQFVDFRAITHRR